MSHLTAVYHVLVLFLIIESLFFLNKKAVLNFIDKTMIFTLFIVLLLQNAFILNSVKSQYFIRNKDEKHVEESRSIVQMSSISRFKCSDNVSKISYS